MARIDIETVVERTRAILEQPEAAPPLTGDSALDGAFADLAQRTWEDQPLETPRLGFWD